MMIQFFCVEFYKVFNMNEIFRVVIWGSSFGLFFGAQARLFRSDPIYSKAFHLCHS